MRIIALVDADSIAYQAGWADTYMDMRNCIDNKLQSIRENTRADKLEIYLEEWRTKKNIFRRYIYNHSNAFVVHGGYKGNRKVHSRKPLLLNKAREYLVKRWNATAVVDFESEDVAIRRAYDVAETKDEAIVCCIDKDLLQHPLKYYNYNTGVVLVLTYQEAILRLYRQVCSGDTTDNIPGLPGMGKVRAEHRIKDPETALKDTVTAYKGRGMPYEYFIEQFNLIYIRKENHTDVIYPLTKEEYDEI